MSNSMVYEKTDPACAQYFATVRSDVVGVQYYHGLAGKGEYVLLRREPHNPYDNNSVQVSGKSRVFRVEPSSRPAGHQPSWYSSRSYPSSCSV